MNIETRDADGDDAGFLLELYRESRREEMESWGWSEEQKQGFLRLQYNARNQSYAEQFPDARDSVILLDGEMVGRILLAELPGETRLVDIAVLPRFQRRGIGSALIERLMGLADVGRKPVRLHVGILNPAKDLYTRLGFRAVQEKSGNLLMEYAAGSRPSGAGDKTR